VIILKRNGLFIFLIFLTGLFLLPLYCEENSLKVGTVNIEMLLKNSLAYKAADLALSRDLAKKQEEIEQKRKELNLLQKKYDGLDGGNIKELKKIQSDIERLKVDLKYLIKSNKKDLNEKKKDAIKEMSKDIIEVIEDYGKKNGFDYIVNESSILVIYSDVNLDITAEMLIKYNNFWESENSTQRSKD